MKGNLYTFTFRQPAIGATGRGTFMLRSDQNNMFASFVMDNEPDKKYTWTGKRK